ncbi:MAG: hypothetical protein WC602_00920 [archaeon]
MAFALMANAYYLGMAGLLIVLLGWAIQSCQTLQNRKTGISRLLSGLYAIGSAFLFVYSFSIGDWIFMAMNAIAALLGATNYVLEGKKFGPKAVSESPKPETQRKARKVKGAKRTKK